MKNPTSKAIKYYCAVTLKWTFQLFYILPETRYDTYDTLCDSTAQINVMYVEKCIWITSSSGNKEM